MKNIIFSNLALLTIASLTAVSDQQVTLAPNSPVCGEAGSATNGRIVGGGRAGNCQFPWMVFIYTRGMGVCGGTIISSTHIITAAHCLLPGQDNWTRNSRQANPQDITVFSGTTGIPFGVNYVFGATERAVTKVTVHENFSNDTLENDIAILKLTRPIVFDRCHKPVCMINGSKTPQQATNCMTMGWGLASNDEDADVESQLKYVDLEVAADYRCNMVYDSTPKQFCAVTNGKGHCFGDSGGPFVCKDTNGRYYLHGVVCAVSGSCARSLGLYTRVSSYLPWIATNTR